MQQRLKDALKLLTGSSDMAAVLRAASVVFSIRVAATVLNYTLIIVLARWMGASEFGVYAFAMSWAVLLAVPASLGIQTMAVRFVASYMAADDMERLRGLLTRSVQTVFTSGALLATVALGAYTAYLGELPLHGRALAVAVGIAGVPVVGLMNLGVQVGRGFGWMAAAFAPPQIGQAGLALAVVGGLIASGVQLTAPLIVAVAIGAFAATSLLQASIYHSRLRPLLRGKSPMFETSLWLRVAIPLVLYEGFQSVITHSDMIMLGVLKDAADVGHYQAAVRTAALTTFVPYSMMSLAGPKIAGLHVHGSRAELQSFVSSVIPWIVLPTLALTLGLAFFAEPILGLFGAGFSAGSVALTVLVLGAFIAVSFGPAPVILNMTGHQDDCARVYAAAAITNVALNAVLIPWLGTLGAALATALTNAGSHAVLSWFVHKRLGVDAWIRMRPGRRVAP